MTPLEISLCLHYHSRIDDDPWLRSEAPIVPSTFRQMVVAGLLEEECGMEAKRRFKPTAKLHAYVQLLANTPLPELAWIDPRTKEVVEKP